MSVKKKISVKNLDQDSLKIIFNQLKVLDPDQPYKIYVLNGKKFRTSNQNKYLWGVVYDTISKRTGYEPEELHEMFKQKFALRTRFSLDQRLTEEYPQSTKMMSTKEMTDYIDKISRWFVEIFQEHIPSPNEMTEEQYIEAYDK